ncbi:hypothetical protein [Pseudonocardia endophytica]|uniref:hypothetical protein n=1 Tax=Pseudonocardia endophytica TaxID=401976 RepID=UPI001047FE81|nr:hypothetical protein [Pseudonocardia endophytica]
MSPPRRFGRRWLLVGAGATALLAAGSADRWLPVSEASGPGSDPARLRDAVLSGVVPHTGVASSAGGLGLPDIPNLETTAALLSTTTRIRVQVAAADRWRIDQLTPVGEIDAYRAGDTEYVWDYGFTRLTTVRPIPPVRLPRASDLAPADLARRLLGITVADPVVALPPRRIAGYDAPGLRVSPSDPDTTISRIDVWALPVAGGALPLALRVGARGVPDSAAPVVDTEFETVDLGAPPDSAIRPTAPPGAERVVAQPGDLAAVLRGLDAPPPPDTLAGRPRVDLPVDESFGVLPGVAVYGNGIGRFVLVPAGRDVARQIIASAGSAGGGPILGFPPDRAVRVATPALSVVVMRRRRGGYLLAGTVAPHVLELGATRLLNEVRP